ncbi:DSHCT-domain-containing protein, partial [Caulochytrium protostelioides]
LIHYLERQELLPVIVFCFSRMLCQQAADGLGSRVDLTGGKAAKSEIRVFVDQSLTRLSPADRQLPQVVVVTGLLMRGIAVHHSGLLPILKEVVEILFTRGLVKVLFATETFAMGVNAPARCVIFSSVKKWNGTTKTWLNPGEYTQMSGRAGRRGLDTTGMVIIAAPEELPDASVLHTMILSRPTKLDSQFRSTFNMQLNLASMESFKIEDMISRSFSENAFQKQAPGRERLYNATHVQRPPQRTRRFMLVKLHVDHILVLTTRHMESGLTQKITAYNVETGSASLVRPHDALMAFASDVLAHHEVPMLDFPKYRDIDIRTPIEECQAIVRQLAHFGCLLCPDLLDHYGTVDVRVALKAQLREIALRLDTANLSHMEDYHRRMLILKHLQYVDDHDIVQLKGRIAVEINTVDSICLTEMLLDNIFADLTPAEVAGLLSSLVFQERSGQDVGASTLEPRLAEGIKQMQRVVANVNAVKSQYELDDIQEVDETIRTGIVDVVYQWAQGVSFGELTRMTTVMEGTLVRNIVRLNETLREVGDAARILGNHALYTKMEAASEAIRRDIVFASSLYF